MKLSLEPVQKFIFKIVAIAMFGGSLCIAIMLPLGIASELFGWGLIEKLDQSPDALLLLLLAVFLLSAECTCRSKEST